MLCRDILLLCSLAVLLVKADLDKDGGAQAMSTDQDSTSDEVPTESMNSISSDQPNDASSMSTEADHGDGHQPGNDVNGSSDVTKNSIEDQDDESPDSDEGVKQK
ncbi:hypothetical protein SKAU_G00397480 [Synaphobranchus kaupii]|uniref:Uncharacterized protein n=1 Tax=Synaphobranchus kaupii TaxID=118154 RepID=A0A9Q1IC00_SYNKA|nr:hypothetical protein SKAU_G00397480 [Synaphobranchus kaupii]